MTNSFQVPFGFVLLKTESVEVPAGVGAGAGNTSSVPILVGLNVPPTNGPVSGTLSGAASSSVMLTVPGVSVSPPTSDRMMAFCPPGPTRRISRSSGKVWLMRSVTRTVLMLAGSPLTLICDGKGSAGPEVASPGMVIGPLLENPPVMLRMSPPVVIVSA